MEHPIWVVKDKLNFRDLMKGDSTYVEAWKIILEHWLFEPARHLSADRKVTDRGIALLTLELGFFEPFGSILTGKDSDGSSQSTFCEGLIRFAKWLLQNNHIGESEFGFLNVHGVKAAPNLIYSFARCGLMHMLTMKGGRIFIDAVPNGRYVMTDYAYEINGENVFLIDPWRLLPLLEKFVGDFSNELCGPGQASLDLFKNFKSTFERSFVAPGKEYHKL